MSIEKKEFWGFTPPSILAFMGTVLAAAGALIWLRQTWGVVLGVVGLCLIGAAIRLNWMKGLDVRWRKVNFVLHIVLFILSIALLVLSWIGRRV
jgi:uncharacterized membrane protein (UPF0136 family)